MKLLYELPCRFQNEAVDKPTHDQNHEYAQEKHHNNRHVGKPMKKEAYQHLMRHEYWHAQ